MEMPKAELYQKLPQYDNLRPEDVAIWERFMEKNPTRFVRVWYNWKIGEPDIPYEAMPENVQQAWHDLTRWKIDVVAEDAEKFYIIEIKPNANAKALGQAIAYKRIWEDMTDPDKQTEAIVLTDKINPITAQGAVCPNHECCAVELWEA